MKTSALASSGTHAAVIRPTCVLAACRKTRVPTKIGKGTSLACAERSGRMPLGSLFPACRTGRQTARNLLISFFTSLIGIVSLAALTFAQDANSQGNAGPQNTAAPLTLTLQDALARARKINPEYHAALTEFGIAKEDRVQSRAALLPNLNYNTAFLYTEGNRTATARSPTGRFVGANGVHEYVSQGNAHQVISLENVAQYRRARAAEAVARARAEIAARGLVVTVVKAYYGFIVAQRRYASVQRAAAEAQHFLDISQMLEHGGEVAHSDVVKAQIQAQQQQRELQEAELEMSRSRLELAVLVFPDFNQNFAAVDDLQTPEPVPSFDEVQSAAGRRNPELRAAIAALNQAKQEVAVAWNGFLPSLGFDYFYGIDANQFAARAPDGTRNLGYAATASLQLPVWNWGANRSKLKQANLRREQAHIELTATQRELLSNLRIFYNEAQTARAELDLLSQSADLAAESLRLTTLRYQAGEASALEVVDAQNTRTQSQNALNDGQVRFRVALANLQTVTGSL
jgi:outer membrane protein TolC